MKNTAKIQRQPKRGEEGYFTLWVLGLCIMVFFIGGISIDVWRAFNARRQLVNLADAAAAAATSQLDTTAFLESDGRIIKLDKAKVDEAVCNLVRTQSNGRIPCRPGSIDVFVNGDTVTVELHDSFNLSLMRILPHDGNPDNPFDKKIEMQVRTTERARCVTAITECTV